MYQLNEHDRSVQRTKVSVLVGIVTFALMLCAIKLTSAHVVIFVVLFVWIGIGAALALFQIRKWKGSTDALACAALRDAELSVMPPTDAVMAMNKSMVLADDAVDFEGMLLGVAELGRLLRPGKIEYITEERLEYLLQGVAKLEAARIWRAMPLFRICPLVERKVRQPGGLRGVKPALRHWIVGTKGADGDVSIDGGPGVSYDVEVGNDQPRARFVCSVEITPIPLYTEYANVSVVDVRQVEGPSTPDAPGVDVPWRRRISVASLEARPGALETMFGPDVLARYEDAEIQLMLVQIMMVAQYTLRRNRARTLAWDQFLKELVLLPDVEPNLVDAITSVLALIDKYPHWDLKYFLPRGDAWGYRIGVVLGNEKLDEGCRLEAAFHIAGDEVTYAFTTVAPL